MDKKYFFFDIDGTLTDQSTHLVVPSAGRTLRKLQENGHFVSIATGRARYKALSVAADLNVHNLVCFGGGCLVIDDRIEEMKYLPRDKAVSLLEHADNQGIGWLLMLDDSDKVYMRDYRFLEQAGLRKELTTYIIDEELDYRCHNILKVYLAYTAAAEKKLDWIDMLGRLRMTESYCVYQYDAKRDGIITMMQHLNAPLNEVVVFGDDLNDLVMFDPQWTSIAMGNGNTELKKKADYVTDTNIHDGIMKACRYFGWID